MRGRSYSYSPSPPRGYRRSPRAKGYVGHGGDVPTSLLVRNLRRDCRPEDLRRPFGRFGPLKDIYLPRDYYTGEPRGFGFVQYVDPADAEEAKYEMDGQIFLGRELTVVFAEENRKKPTEMRARERVGGRRYERGASYRYSRSPPPYYGRSRSRNSIHRHRSYSRSFSPRDRRHRRERSLSRSPSYGYSGSRSRSPRDYY